MAGGEVGGRLRRVVLSWLVPDAEVLWVPFAIATGRRLSRRTGSTALLSAGPPHSAHLAALAFRSTADRWVVDAQDPWADHPFPVSDSRARRAVDRWMEARVVRRADVVVSATRAQSRSFRSKYGDGKHFVTLPSGFDEREFAGLVPRRGLRRRLLHLGSFYGARSPSAFFEALRRIGREHSQLLGGWEVLLAGYADPASRWEIERAIADPLLSGVVAYVPHIGRREGLEHALGSDALLLVTDPLGGGGDLIPIKTFEYLRAGRPIVALVPPGETAELLARTGGAVVAHPADPEAIAAALRIVLRDPGGLPTPDAGAVASLEFGRALDALSAILAGGVGPADEGGE